MYKIEVHEKINKIFDVYVQLGLWKSEAAIPSLQKLLFFIFYLGYPTCYLCGGILGNDKNEFAFLTSLGVGTSVVALKLAYILWRQAEIRELTFEVGSHTVTDFEESVKAGAQIKNLIGFSCGFLLLTGVCGVTAIIFYLPSFTSEKMLPFNMWCPMNCKNSLITYWIVYVYSSTGTLITIIGMSLNVITWYLMFNCAIKYDIIKSQFRNLTKTKPEAKEEKLHLEELASLMKTNYNLRKTIERFKRCFANLFLVQIFTSGIGICGSVYALAFTDEDDLLQFGINCVLLLHSLFDVFMVMYFGNEIKLSSERLSYSLFESDWIVHSETYKKCLIIVTEFVKQPHNLVIAKLYPLNLKTFSSILNLVYSMLNVLKNSK